MSLGWASFNVAQILLILNGKNMEAEESRSVNDGFIHLLISLRTWATNLLPISLLIESKMMEITNRKIVVGLANFNNRETEDPQGELLNGQARLVWG